MSRVTRETFSETDHNLALTEPVKPLPPRREPRKLGRRQKLTKTAADRVLPYTTSERAIHGSSWWPANR